MLNHYEKRDCGHDSEGNPIERDRETGKITGDQAISMEFHAKTGDLFDLLNMEDY